MDETDRDIIRSNIPALSEDLDFDTVSTLLHSKGVFEIHHIEEFESKPSQKKRSLALLYAIQRKGPNAFKLLCESLVEAKQLHLAKLLRSSCPALPLRSAHDARPFENGGQPTFQPGFPSGNGDSPMDVSPSETAPAIAPREYYKMSSKPWGKALIINNKKFEKSLPRKGTDKDRDDLKDTFERLGFCVSVENDLKGKDIERSIKQLSEDDHSKFDCVILAILSHGKKGVVKGTDSGEVEINEMIALFNADKCQTLRGKPKLFFIQACRGKNKDPGVEASDAGVETDDAGAEASDGVGPGGDGCSENDFIDLQTEARMLLQPEVDSTDCPGSVKSKIPSHADVLLGYSTIPAFASWRKPNYRGSWYIQALTEVFKRDAKKEDLVSMMATVNARVASEESPSSRSKQTSVFESSLRKKLFFLPSQ